jgi:hypothetical protein
MNVTKDNFYNIERLWAENGIVNVMCKDGQHTTLTITEAAHRAFALNGMDVPDWYKKSRNTLVERIIEVCKEAKKQQEDPKDKKTEAVKNILQGKSLDGKEIKETIDQLIKRFSFMFPTLSQKEIEVVASNKDISVKNKERLLKEIHRQRMEDLGTDRAVEIVAPKLKKIEEK